MLAGPILVNPAPSSNFGCTGTINNMLITWKCKKTSYGLISHVACTYSYFLRYWKPNSVRCLPSFLPRELLLSIFPILEDGGRRADSWCWRAPCHLHVLHGQRGATSSTGLHLNAKWIVFSFLFFYVIYFDCSTIYHETGE